MPPGHEQYIHSDSAIHIGDKREWHGFSAFTEI